MTSKFERVEKRTTELNLLPPLFFFSADHCYMTGNGAGLHKPPNLCIQWHSALIHVSQRCAVSFHRLCSGGIKFLNTESVWPNYQRVSVKLKYILNSIQIEVLEWVVQMRLCCNVSLEYFECCKGVFLKAPKAILGKICSIGGHEKYQSMPLPSLPLPVNLSWIPRFCSFSFVYITWHVIFVMRG